LRKRDLLWNPRTTFVRGRMAFLAETCTLRVGRCSLCGRRITFRVEKIVFFAAGRTFFGGRITCFAKRMAFLV
jgi:hypothetical protein